MAEGEGKERRERSQKVDCLVAKRKTGKRDEKELKDQMAPAIDPSPSLTNSSSIASQKPYNRR